MHIAVGPRRPAVNFRPRVNVPGAGSGRRAIPGLASRFTGHAGPPRPGHHLRCLSRIHLSGHTGVLSYPGPVAPVPGRREGARPDAHRGADHAAIADSGHTWGYRADYSKCHIW
jgi:hypothetical protein